jgi:enoyl-CoA hydratase/carnithine racemase
MPNFKVAELPHHLHLDFFAPAAGNAFGLEVARELSDVRKQYRKWTKPVVVSSVHPSLFCSGGNLSDYQQLKTKSAGLKVNREIGKHLADFGRWPVVKLAVVEGDVLGGGMEWLAHFDYRWSTPYAYFSFWQRRIGLSFGWGGGRAWALKIGESRVRALLAESRLLSAEHAARLGLVDRVMPTWKIRENVMSWATWMDKPAAARVSGWSVAGEAALFSELWMGEDHKAALAKWRKSSK